ncbi:MAG: dephospho-CoA kinase [Patescibacteria group bacterium]
MKVIGVNGHTGSGKSTVCRVFERLGAYYIDADSVVHALYEKGNAGARKIEIFFGEEFLKSDGSVNRNKLRKVILGDSRKLKILNNLIHPLVAHEVEKLLKKCAKDICVIEAISFDKKHLGRLIDKLIWVDRILDKKNERISNLQEKPEKVDFVLDNNCSKTELKEKSKKLWRKIMSL